MTTYLGKLGELTLKGSNLKMFERSLTRNTKHYLESVNAKVTLLAGRLYIECDEESEKAVEFTLDHLIGITGWAKTVVAEKNIEDINKAAYELALSLQNAPSTGSGSAPRTFKIECRRVDKKFPLGAYQVCCEAANKIDAELMKVDVHNPDVVIFIEIREKVFLYASKMKNANGVRGLPVGSSGKGLLLLSGGIDSPVAGFRMMRRGMEIECVYFHSYPYTSEEAQKKVEDLAETIANYGLKTHLNIIPFTDVQMELKKKAPENTLTLLLRMCMMKAANMLAERVNASSIITGESLGQVASQTIENMSVTESCAAYPVMRPLIGLDKEEIIETAIKIGTYETSILPYEDCCVLFSPRHPVLHADVSEMQKLYKSLEIDGLIEKAFNERVIKRFDSRGFVAKNFGCNEKASVLSQQTAIEITEDLRAK